MNWLEPVVGWLANLIQISTFLFTLWILWRTRQRLKQALKRIQTETTNNPVVLSIGIGQDIKGTVASYVENHLPDIDPEKQIRNYSRTGKVPSDKFYLVLRDLLHIKQELTTAGVTEVHLFYMGPVTLAMAVGAVFDNWVPAKIYKYQNGQYEFDFVLEKGSVLGLLDEIASEGEESVAQKFAG